MSEIEHRVQSGENQIIHSHSSEVAHFSSWHFPGETAWRSRSKTINQLDHISRRAWFSLSDWDPLSLKHPIEVHHCVGGMINKPLGSALMLFSRYLCRIDDALIVRKTSIRRRFIQDSALINRSSETEKRFERLLIDRSLARTPTWESAARRRFIAYRTMISMWERKKRATDNWNSSPLYWLLASFSVHVMYGSRRLFTA